MARNASARAEMPAAVRLVLGSRWLKFIFVPPLPCISFRAFYCRHRLNSKFLVGAGSRNQSNCLRRSILADREIGLNRFAAAYAGNGQTERAERRGGEDDPHDGVIFEAAGIVGVGQANERGVVFRIGLQVGALSIGGCVWRGRLGNRWGGADWLRGVRGRGERRW